MINVSTARSRRREKVPQHILPVEERVDNFREVNLGYLTWEEAMIEADRCYLCRKPKCVEACPAHFDIPSFIKAIQEGEGKKAREILETIYSFPKSIDRICPQFCRDACIAQKKGDPIQIMDLKRFIADRVDVTESFFEKEESTGHKIAIIGAGPGGLTAAYYLAKQGHEVVVYEKAPVPGGMLTLGIPQYRLPKEIMFEEVDDIEKLGVKFQYGATYGKDFNYKDLFDLGFDAVLISHGAHKPKWMKIPGEDLEGVVHAIEFLRDVNLGKDVKLGKKIAVIGGGDVAIDAVRVAKRLGADVHLIYRRSREQMPAVEEEIEAAEEEGIPLHVLRNPIEIIGEDGKVKALKLIKMKLGEPDSSGRPRPVPIEGSEYIEEYDMVIEAISEEPEYDYLEKDGFKLTRWHTFEVDPETYMTNIEGVWAAGDDVTGPATAVEAIAAAHKVVQSINAYLKAKRETYQGESAPLTN